MSSFPDLLASFPVLYSLFWFELFCSHFTRGGAEIDNAAETETRAKRDKETACGTWLTRWSVYATGMMRQAERDIKPSNSLSRKQHGGHRRGNSETTIFSGADRIHGKKIDGIREGGERQMEPGKAALVCEIW